MIPYLLRFLRRVGHHTIPQALHEIFNEKLLKRHRLEAEDNNTLYFFQQFNCQRILDLGCGNVRFMKFCLKQGLKSIGIEKNQETLDLLAEDNLLPIVCGDVLHIPFQDQSFSGVHCSHLIEHFLPDEAYQLLKEAGRVLKLGGILVIRTPLLWKHFYDDFTHIKPYNPNALMRYLCHYGGQRSKTSMPYRFVVVKLIYRYLPLFYRKQEAGQTRSLFMILFDFLYKLGIKNPFKKDGFTLILRRVQ